jgi:integrase
MGDHEISQFVRKEIIVRQGKGDKNRTTMLPKEIIPLFHSYIEECQRFHEVAIQRT